MTVFAVDFMLLGPQYKDHSFNNRGGDQMFINMWMS